MSAKWKGTHMRDEGKTKFYKTKGWKETRRAYLSSVGNLCENCLTKGIYRPAEIVHHKEHITPANVTNPEVSLAWDNLQALCRKCHAEQHDDIYNRESFRYKFEGGTIILQDSPC